MTQHELRNKLLVALSDLCIVKNILEYAMLAGVPPDSRHVVQLDTAAKQLASILAKLDDLVVEPNQLESA